MRNGKLIAALIVALAVVLALALILPGHGDTTPGQPSPHAVEQSQQRPHLEFEQLRRT